MQPRCLTNEEAWEEYQQYWDAKRPGDPLFTYSGWLLHNHVQVQDEEHEL